MQTSAEDVIKAVRAGEVLAPVGTKTFAVLMVTDEGRLEAAGTIAVEHADELAYWIMAQKRMPKESKDGAADKNV